VDGAVQVNERPLKVTFNLGYGAIHEFCYGSSNIIYCRNSADSRRFLIFLQFLKAWKVIENEIFF